MGLQIVSGDQNPYSLVIDENGRARTSSLSFPGLVRATDLGKAFYIASTHLAITNTASMNGILYVKNTSSITLRIHSIRTCNSASYCHWAMIKNPTAGTLISGASAALTENLRFDSGQTFQGVAYKGVSGATVTDGSQVSQWINSTGESIEAFMGGIRLATNNSIAFTAKPSASGDCCVSFLCFFEEKSPTGV